MESHDHGLLRTLADALRRPVPAGSRGYLAFGWPILVLFLLQVVTGILLSFYYESSPDMAYESIRYIMRDVGSGWLVRGLHYWAGRGMIALGILQLIRVFLTGAYKGANGSSWYIGLLLLFLTFGFAFTGDLLTWDQEAYWSAVLALRWIESIPLVGTTLALLLQGAPEVGAPTLSRFYSIHTLILPWLCFYLLLLHLWFLMKRRARTAQGA